VLDAPTLFFQRIASRSGARMRSTEPLEVELLQVDERRLLEWLSSSRLNE
jgi:hypothetical protein